MPIRRRRRSRSTRKRPCIVASTSPQASPVFLFASENEGGQGSWGGSVRHRPAKATHQYLRSFACALATRSLGRRELKPCSNWTDGRPETELNFKFIGRPPTRSSAFRMRRRRFSMVLLASLPWSEKRPEPLDGTPWASPPRRGREELRPPCSWLTRRNPPARSCGPGKMPSRALTAVYRPVWRSRARRQSRFRAAPGCAAR